MSESKVNSQREGIWPDIGFRDASGRIFNSAMLGSVDSDTCLPLQHHRLFQCLNSTKVTMASKCLRNADFRR